MEQLTIPTRHGRMALTRSGAGEPVLLLHGIPGSRDSWRDVVPLLCPDATVLVPDLLGFGASGRPRDLATLHARGQAEALADVLDALAVESVTVVGHDFGGPVGLMLTGRVPRRVVRLGLLATNAFPDTPVPFPLSLVRQPVVGRLLAPALFSRASLAAMLIAGVGRPRPRLDLGSHLGDRAQVRVVRTIFEGSLRELDALYAPVQRRLDQWTGPALVMWGDRDPFFATEQGHRTATTAGTTLTLLARAGHFLPEERPDEVAAAVRALLTAPLSFDPASPG
ncbi:pimeloyl-ACP methyl ester carboxylesterase [Blastococcus colisei]|uniref:Pimeloyl-ACP methyl ester carboxylesterase n=1 Tax=Blastococcus colisei TaxID=1564162 RepID=A0A543PDE7_9ACTN|nr:alpha/beta hydrolase [Blastococcus colisei]TQN42108.1 pimeloyl-ACP methyl ester carboxylesterase [Blastococcus colisei]